MDNVELKCSSCVRYNCPNVGKDFLIGLCTQYTNVVKTLLCEILAELDKQSHYGEDMNLYLTTDAAIEIVSKYFA